MRAHRSHQESKGFTLVEILIVVAIMGILLAVAVPHFMKAREGSHARACQSNLKQTLGAKERWAMDNNRSASDTPVWADLVGGFLKVIPVCPGGGNYTIGGLDELPTCTVGGVRGEFNAHVLP